MNHTAVYQKQMNRIYKTTKTLTPLWLILQKTIDFAIGCYFYPFVFKFRKEGFISNSLIASRNCVLGIRNLNSIKNLFDWNQLQSGFILGNWQLNDHLCSQWQFSHSHSRLWWRVSDQVYYGLHFLPRVRLVINLWISLLFMLCGSRRLWLA